MASRAAGAAPAAPAGAESSVKVAVRIRPMLSIELADGSRQCCRLSGAANQVVVGKDKSFTFDAAYDDASAQEGIFEHMIVPLVDSMLEGLILIFQ